MGTIDYEALIAEHRADIDRRADAAQRATAERLVDVASNLQTLRERAAEQKADSPEQASNSKDDEIPPTEPG
jgi:hypothetical protein